MKILQIATSLGQNCGIALFADTVHLRLREAGVEIETAGSLIADPAADIVLLQHHGELIAATDVIAFCRNSSSPVVLFAHDDGIGALSDHVTGLVAMCPGIIPATTKPVHLFPHPAWTPAELYDRGALRHEFGLPADAVIIGSNGFLKFERQFVEIVNGLLPHAQRNNWFVGIVASPWRLESPGLIVELERIQERFPDQFRIDYAFLDAPTLNRRLQACDLLWCWTEAPSQPYASGVISDQYASGTRIFAADKQQHGHVLPLPNVVRGAARLENYIEQLVTEIRTGNRQRHSPEPIGWDNCIGGFIDFLKGFLPTASDQVRKR